MFPCPTEPAFSVTSDASGSLDCGGWSGSSWFQLEWPREARDRGISLKEMFAGLAVATVCGVRWLCDNQPAMFSVNKRSYREGPMTSLIRCLYFFEAWFSFEMVASQKGEHAGGRPIA